MFFYLNLKWCLFHWLSKHYTAKPLCFPYLKFFFKTKIPWTIIKWNLKVNSRNPLCRIIYIIIENRIADGTSSREKFRELLTVSAGGGFKRRLTKGFNLECRKKTRNDLTYVCNIHVVVFWYEYVTQSSSVYRLHKKENRKTYKMIYRFKSLLM